MTARLSAPAVRVATLSVLVAAALLAASYGLSHPLYSEADELAHLDHAFQLWHGRLPDFYAGVQIHPPFGFRPPWQWTTQHPPLFYLLEAPVVGPLLDGHHFVAAGYAGRLLNAVLAAATAGAVMWTARAIAPRRPSFWLGAGVVTATNPAVVSIGGLIYNDDAFVATTTLVLGVTVRIVRHGVSAGRLAMLALAASAAMLTRSSSCVMVGLCGLALAVVVLRRPGRWRALAGLVVAGGACLVASGWFYLYNLHATGNLLGEHFEVDLPNRHNRSLGAVLVDPEVWRQWHLVWGQGVVSSGLMAWLLVGVPLAAALLLIGVRARGPREESAVVAACVLAALTVLVILMQAQYVAARGGASWRYLMPLVPVVSLAVAWVATARRRLTAPLLGVWLAGVLVPSVLSTHRALAASAGPSYAAVRTFHGTAVAALVLGMAAVVFVLVVVARLALSEDGPGAPADYYRLRLARNRTRSS